MFKAHLSDLERAFDLFAGKNSEGVVSKGPKFMSLADFEDLLMLAHLCRDRDEPSEVVTGMQAAPSSYSFTQADTKPMGVVRMTTRRSVHEDGGTPGVAHAVPPQHERVVKMAFAHSIQTVVNPNVSHRQQHLSFVEFIEAVRLCASVSQAVLYNATARRISQVGVVCACRAREQLGRFAEHSVPGKQVALADKLRPLVQQIVFHLGELDKSGGHAGVGAGAGAGAGGAADFG